MQSRKFCQYRDYLKMLISPFFSHLKVIKSKYVVRKKCFFIYKNSQILGINNTNSFDPIVFTIAFNFYRKIPLFTPEQSHL